MSENSLPAEISDLIEKCQEAKVNAHCPYSHFRVGAALLTKDGTLFTGCNVENASYTLGVCAERCAIFKAVSEGHKKIKAIAIASDIRERFIAPCGACRQVMFEFGGDELEVYLTKPDLSFEKTSMGALLPGAFGHEALMMAKVDTE